MFKNIIKTLRINKELTQLQVANLLNITKTGYASWEQGRTEPDFNNLKRLSQIFNVTTDYLLDNTQENEKQEIANIKTEIQTIYDNLNRPRKNLLIGFAKELAKAEQAENPETKSTIILSTSNNQD